MLRSLQLGKLVHIPRIIALIGVLISLPSISASAAQSISPALKFGPEFTFSSEAIHRMGITDPELRALIQRFKAHLIDGQPAGQEFKFDQRIEYGELATTIYQFKSPNGWSFEITKDPGVIEVTMNPMTVAEFKRYQDDIQDAIFETMANAGYTPWMFLGGGHISMSYEPFAKNRLLLRNFIVDFWNHNELSMGVLGYDTNNALPFWLNNPIGISKVREFLDSSFERDIDPAIPIDNWIAKLNNSITSGVTNPFYLAWHPNSRAIHWNSQKFLDLNTSTINSISQRLEVRCVRPQTSIKTWIQQIELLEARIQYLSTIQTRLPLNPIVPLQTPINATFDGDGGHILNPPVDPQKALQAFHQYVTESGLPWSEHRDYLWPKWITDGELARFEANSCAKQLE